MVGDFQKLTKAIEKDSEKASLRKVIKRESQSIRNALAENRTYTIRDEKGRAFRISPSGKKSD